MTGIRFQSTLGRITQDNYRPDMNMSGYLAVGRVLKVHHKSNTADVVLVNTNDTITSSGSQEGKFAARILQNFANYDPKRGKAWGSITPMAVGSLVLVGYLDNMKSKPIILGQFPRPEVGENTLPTTYPLDEKSAGYTRREALKTVEVYPSLAYKKIDGESNVEFAHASKTFFAMYNTNMDVDNYLDDNHLGFDHQNLTETDNTTGEVITSDVPEAQAPTKILFVHRSAFDDQNTTWTKFFVAASGLLRITRDNNDGKLSFMEIAEDGTMSFTRQLDNPNHHQSVDYSQFMQDASGNTLLQRVQGDTTTQVGVTSYGSALMQRGESVIEMSDGKLTIETDGEIESDALSRFIQTNHIVVSDTAPENPTPNLIWVDTSADELRRDGICLKVMELTN